MSADLSAVVRDLAPTGVLRAAINHGNPVLAQRGDDGQPQGVSVDLAREAARRLNLPLGFVPFEGAGAVTDAAAHGVWDIAFLAVDPKRAEQIGFTAPYVVIEASLLVPEPSPLQNFDDMDRPGVRMAVGRGAAYELYLSRTVKQAQLVRFTTSAEALDQFLAQGLEAAAGVRQPLVRFAEQHPGLRVLPGRFTAIEQGMGTPRGRDTGLAWLQHFVEDVKASGFVAEALARHGQAEAVVAPPAAGRAAADGS